jgi:arginine decarboxylase
MSMSEQPNAPFLGEAELVAVDQALGRVSCESIAGYPPGIPSLLPGERISDEIVNYLRALTASGARLHGARHSTFRPPGTATERATRPK